MLNLLLRIDEVFCLLIGFAGIIIGYKIGFYGVSLDIDHGRPIGLLIAIGASCFQVGIGVLAGLGIYYLETLVSR